MRERLEAYVDNELDGIATKSVAAHLERCVQCRSEAEAIREQDRLLVRAVESSGRSAPQLRASIEAATVKRRPGRGPGLPAWARTPLVWGIGAVSAVVIAAGCIGQVWRAVRMRGQTNQERILRAAGSMHVDCTSESAAPDWLHTPAAVTWISGPHLDPEVRVPPILRVEYRFARARLCQLDGEQFLHLVYEDATGRPASLFIGRGGRKPPRGPRSVTPETRVIRLSQVEGLDVASSQAAGRMLIIAAAAGDEAAGLMTDALAIVA